MTICCNTGCPHRLGCRKFLRALDVVSGKTAGYEEIECKDYKFYEP